MSFLVPISLLSLRTPINPQFITHLFSLEPLHLRVILAVQDACTYKNHPNRIVHEIETAIETLYKAAELERRKQTHRSTIIYLLNVPLFEVALAGPTRFEDVIKGKWDAIYTFKTTNDWDLAIKPRLLADLAKYDPISLSRHLNISLKFFSSEVASPSLPSLTSPLPMPSPKLPEEIADTPQHDAYKNVVLGGSFDHLHTGHRMLLTIAAWIATEQINLGLTDNSLLTRKANSEYMQDYKLREEAIRSFMKLVCRRDANVNIVKLVDLHGPSVTMEGLDALVATTETSAGADLVNQERVKRGLKSLTIIKIDVLNGSVGVAPTDMTQLREWKLSSSWIRSMEKAAIAPSE